MEYKSRMTIDEIKKELEMRGWTYAMLASKLKTSEGTIRGVLSRHRPMTPALENHIELLFQQTRTAVFVYSVDIPDGTCREWVPGWDDMTPKQRECAVRAVVMKTLERLKQIGMECLSEQDREAMAACCTELSPRRPR